MFNIFGSKKINNPVDTKTTGVSTEKNLKKLTIDQLRELNDAQVISLLKEAWNISVDEPIIVWGEIKKINNFYKLINVNIFDGNTIEYPLEDIDDKLKISYTGINISAVKSSIKKYYDQGIRFISCQLVLESISKRGKNPLMVQAEPNTIKPLEEIPIINTIEINNETLLVEKVLLITMPR